MGGVERHSIPNLLPHPETPHITTFIALEGQLDWADGANASKGTSESAAELADTYAITVVQPCKLILIHESIQLQYRYTSTNAEIYT